MNDDEQPGQLGTGFYEKQPLMDDDEKKHQNTHTQNDMDNP